MWAFGAYLNNLLGCFWTENDFAHLCCYSQTEKAESHLVASQANGQASLVLWTAISHSSSGLQDDEDLSSALLGDAVKD